MIVSHHGWLFISQAIPIKLVRIILLMFLFRGFTPFRFNKYCLQFQYSYYISHLTYNNTIGIACAAMCYKWNYMILIYTEHSIGKTIKLYNCTTTLTCVYDRCNYLIFSNEISFYIYCTCFSDSLVVLL